MLFAMGGSVEAAAGSSRYTSSSTILHFREMRVESPVDAYIGDNQDRLLEELKEFLRMPSVSTLPQHRGDITRAAEFVAAKLAGAGLANVRRIETAGHPLVYGEWLGAPGKPTVLCYGHYDVQPVDPVEEWRHPPFEPTRDGDNLVARGATDDKGQSYTHLLAVEAMLAERGALPVNVKLICEGEEESGGAAIERFVTEDAGRRIDRQRRAHS